MFVESLLDADLEEDEELIVIKRAKFVEINFTYSHDERILEEMCQRVKEIRALAKRASVTVTNYPTDTFLRSHLFFDRNEIDF